VIQGLCGTVISASAQTEFNTASGQLKGIADPVWW